MPFTEIEQRYSNASPAHWRTWKQRFQEMGVRILNDDSGHADGDIVTFKYAFIGLQKCTTESQAEPKILTTEDWKREFAKQMSREFKPGDKITALSGRVRINIELEEGKQPFMFARVFLPKVVGSNPIWQAAGLEETYPFGMKVIMTPRTRDEIIRRHPDLPDYIGVSEIEIVRRSATKSSYLGTVSKW